MRPLGILLLAYIVFLTACGSTATSAPQTYTPTPPPASPTDEVCRAAPAQPTPAASLFPPVTAADWSTGPADAPVTITVYNDYQCVECNDKLLTDLLVRHPKDLRLVYRPYPQPALYDKSLIAAQAAEAAGAQGKYWEMHNLLFAKQAEWVQLTPDQFEAWLGPQAESLGIDLTRFEVDRSGAAIAEKIQRDITSGKAAGIPVLPLILINGQVYTALKDEYTFDQVIRLTALGARQFGACPPMQIDPRKQYLAKIQTTRGEMVLELYADKAPFTVNSFVFLARQGWFDDSPFLRIAPGLVNGDPSGTGLGNPGYIFANETDAALRFDAPGTLAMLNLGPDTNGSQFFITFAPQPALDGKYTIFGRVLSGLEILEAMITISNGTPQPVTDRILSVQIEER
jgi:cyclophilin family peptidyl-prolyl cis-trans isomerase/protein-disulfide isomerase